MNLVKCRKLLDKLEKLSYLSNDIDPNYIFEGKIEGSGETYHYPLLFQAIVRQNLLAISKLMEMGVNLETHFYITDEQKHCIYAVSAKDMAHKIYKRDFSPKAGEIYCIIKEYFDNIEKRENAFYQSIESSYNVQM